MRSPGTAIRVVIARRVLTEAAAYNAVSLIITLKLIFHMGAEMNGLVG